MSPREHGFVTASWTFPGGGVSHSSAGDLAYTDRYEIMGERLIKSREETRAGGYPAGATNLIKFRISRR